MACCRSGAHTRPDKVLAFDARAASFAYTVPPEYQGRCQLACRMVREAAARCKRMRAPNDKGFFVRQKCLPAFERGLSRLFRGTLLAGRQRRLLRQGQRPG